jgi:hypothetical protein
VLCRHADHIHAVSLQKGVEVLKLWNFYLAGATPLCAEVEEVWNIEKHIPIFICRESIVFWTCLKENQALPIPSTTGI